jgi:hypothetical protein
MTAHGEISVAIDKASRDSQLSKACEAEGFR